MYAPQYPFQNPYQQFNPQQFTHTNPQQIVKVNGKNGAEMYQMSPNSSVLLLDETAPIVWLAQTDGAGYKTLSAYDITPHQEIPPVDTRALEQRISKLEEAIQYVNKSNLANVTSQSDGSFRSSQTTSTNAQNRK